jgi:hypothetical protein
VTDSMYLVSFAWFVASTCLIVCFFFSHSDGIFVNPQDSTESSCSELNAFALGGGISESNCGFLPSFVPNCGCQAEGSSTSGGAAVDTDAPTGTPITGDYPQCNICGGTQVVTIP